MSRRTEIALAAAAVAVSLAAWLFPGANSQSSATGPERAQRGRPLLERLLATPVLQVSGTGSTVRIRKGSSDSTFVSSEISSPGADSVVYLPLGQALKLEVSGTGAEVLIEAELMPQVQVINTATGASVIAF